MNRYTVQVFEETFDPNDKEAWFRTYNVPASTELDARLLAFVLDKGLEGAKYGEGSTIEDGEVELAKTYTTVEEN